MGTSIISFNKNPNIGLFAYATDKYVLVGKEVIDNASKEIEKYLKVPVYKVNIAGTGMLGVFLAGDGEKLLVPHIAFNSELEALDKLGIEYEVYETDMTCLGNNMVFTSKGALVNPEFKAKEVERLKKVLGVPIIQTMVADTETPGSCITIIDGKALVHRDVSSTQIKLIEETLGVKVSTGTVNMGSPYIKSGIIANKNGLLVGEGSGPAEIMNAEEELGYLDRE